MLVKCLLKFRPSLIQNYASKIYCSSYALMIKDFGDPCKVVEKVDTQAQISLSTSLNNNQVLVKFLAAPINPADINTIQGTYGIKPQLPAVVGGEGVARVIKVGPNVNLKPDDLVLPSLPSYGTWRSYAIGNESDFMAIDKDLDIMIASQLIINPFTAYRMLKDFIELRPGDSILQNGANSAVGLFVIQLAKEWGLKSINVIRARPNNEATLKLKQDLDSYGADHIIFEDDLRNREKMSQLWSSGLRKPKIALNCVAGENAMNCMRHIAPGGIMVTYGGMSRKPLTVPVGVQIFNDIKFFGFWLSRWRETNKNSKSYVDTMSDLVKLFKQGRLRAPRVTAIPASDYKVALEKAMQPYVNSKVVLML